MAAIPEEEDLRKALASILLKDDNDDEGIVDGIDGDIVSYLAGMLHEGLLVFIISSMTCYFLFSLSFVCLTHVCIQLCIARIYIM